jgi:hypothetical protein
LTNSLKKNSFVFSEIMFRINIGTPPSITAC